MVCGKFEERGIWGGDAGKRCPEQNRLEWRTLGATAESMDGDRRNVRGPTRHLEPRGGDEEGVSLVLVGATWGGEVYCRLRSKRGEKVSRLQINATASGRLKRQLTGEWGDKRRKTKLEHETAAVESMIEMAERAGRYAPCRMERC